MSQAIKTHAAQPDAQDWALVPMVEAENWIPKDAL